MDSFELNKILGAVLFTCLVVLGMSIVSEAVFTSTPPEQAGYAIDIPEDEGAVAAGEEDEGETPLPVRLAAASVEDGEGAIRPCVACHTFEEGGQAQVGPNLYNVVGNEKAHMEGFGYSSAMEERAAAGETWGYEELDAFLADPRGYIEGTTMSFAGVRDPQTRADIIAYLASISPGAPEMPEADEAAEDEAAEGDEAAADEDAVEDTGDAPESDGNAEGDGEADQASDAAEGAAEDGNTDGDEGAGDDESGGEADEAESGQGQ